MSVLFATVSSVGVLGSTAIEIAEARALDAAPATRDLPLAGVPVAIKDNVAVTGEVTTFGSAAVASWTAASSDHAVVAKLRAAGAVVVGITRVPELCLFAPTDCPDAVTRSGVDWTAAALAVLGHSVAPVRVPYPTSAVLTVVFRWYAVAAADADDIGADPARLQDRARRHAQLGRLITRFELIRPGPVRAFEDRLRRLFSDIDVLITPILTGPRRSRTGGIDAAGSATCSPRPGSPRTPPSGTWPVIPR